ncbi:MAG: hypothetical protein QOJ24_3617 [Mycobacterium sp.]|jgi:phosphinothricin acetyltransferase|nr:hypothetical protein [Mycobacterium sp.]
MEKALHTVEDAVYLSPAAVGRGIGGRLLDALLIRCSEIGVRQVIAVIVDDDAEHRLRCTVIAASWTRAG